MQLYRDKEIVIELPDDKDNYEEILRKFYKENIASDEDEDDKDINFLENKLHDYIKNHVLHFLNRDYSNVVLLVGAGASVVSENNVVNNRYGKTMCDIAWKIFSKLYGNPPLKGFLPISYAKKFLPENIRNTITDATFKKMRSEKFDFPLEEYISNLNLYIEDAEKNGKSVRYPSLAQAKKLKKLILLEIIDAVDYQYNGNMPFKHNQVILKLLKFKHSSSQKIMVVTTNYDLAIEKSLENDDFTIFDGFEFGENGKFNDDMFEWVLSKEVNNINTKEVIYKKHVIDLLKIHGSIDWIKKDEKIVRSSIDDVKNSIKNEENSFKMIFPSSNKYAQSYEEPYFDLMTRFQSKLRQPNTLLVTAGFSFGDNHISRMVINAIKHNPSLNCLITDFNIQEFNSNNKPDNVNNNWYELDKLRDRGYNIGFLKTTMCNNNDDLSYYLG